MTTFVIKTEILSFDPQPGMKSTQTIDVDFSSKSVKSSYVTGTTKIGSWELKSVRDAFTIKNIVFSDQSVTFKTFGQTASGVGFMPNIDYEMAFKVNADGSGTVEGAHDGYPAYSIKKGTEVIYQYKHKSKDLQKLFGSKDTKFGPCDF